MVSQHKSARPQKRCRSVSFTGSFGIDLHGTTGGGKVWSTGTIQTLLKSETARGVYINA
ncbi:hypothetical protein [Arthrobacter methylotrophus]|uniref:hypothetical protein n=1 Tax=Arthrobacter methylotrophus TaxID=121291 RepID=UPI0031ED5468